MDLVFYAKLYALTFAVFLAVDLLWLGVVARGFYQTQLRPFLRPTVNWPAAFVFYLLYVVGILIFAVRPGLAADSLAVAAGWGALFGFFTYATYELTNLATLKDWPLKVVLVDMAWGVALCTVVASAGFLLGVWLGSPG